MDITPQCQPTSKEKPLHIPRNTIINIREDFSATAQVAFLLLELGLVHLAPRLVIR
jgi:hypothetical protein